MVDLSGAGQGMQSRRSAVDLTVEPSDYFGVPVEKLRNADTFGIERTGEQDLYRVQYLYLMVFGNENSSTDYGGIQVRAQTYLYLDEGTVPARKFQRVMQRCAHRGAFLFDSGLQHPVYGGGGGEWSDGGGYLSGFTPVENGGEYRNWEVEPVGSAEGKPAGAQPGVIRWTTEIYLEVDGTKYADLSGVGQGIADQYNLVEHDEPPTEGIEAQQEWWEVTWNDSRGSYDIHPPGRTASKDRARRLHEKDVYLNGLKIGSITTDGRVWLKKQYADRYDGTYSGNHSKRSVTSNTSATGQSIRGTNENPGKLAKVDESPGAVYLATAQFRPDDFDPVDPDEVDVDREIVPGSSGGTIYLLSLPDDATDPTRTECRQDQEVIRHLGYSEPPYSHTYAETWQWPGYRSIAEHGGVVWRRGDPDDDQQSLDSFGGDGQ